LVVQVIVALVCPGVPDDMEEMTGGVMSAPVVVPVTEADAAETLLEVSTAST
jgi:hypothetical protein